MQIPMSSPDLTAADVEAVTSVLDTRYLSLGPRIVEFEECFAAYIGVCHAVGVSSGTAGLHLAVIGWQSLDGLWSLCYTGSVGGDDISTVEKKA